MLPKYDIQMQQHTRHNSNIDKMKSLDNQSHRQVKSFAWKQRSKATVNTEC